MIKLDAVTVASFWSRCGRATGAVGGRVSVFGGASRVGKKLSLDQGARVGEELRWLAMFRDGCSCGGSGRVRIGKRLDEVTDPASP